ncbi:MAG TPA: MMPL family transporter [Actinomycetota bacterium]|mgnify:CR=1 FL=1|nr:MMPL family transporter [Actinomycetota bacterium]
MNAQVEQDRTPAGDPESRSPERTPKARRAVWLAVVVAIAWLVIGSVAGPLSGKLGEVQENDNASFLPATAESTRVAQEQKKFSEENALPVLVVVTSGNGAPLTAQQQAEGAEFAAAIPELPVTGGTKVGDYLNPGPLLPIPSQDGQALLISVPINADKAGQNLADGELTTAGVTDAIREGAEDYPGLQINVTGPGGILADLVKVFGAIDTALLGATALVVALILIMVYRSPFIWLIPLLSAGMALSAASAIVYFLAKTDVLTLNGQSQGILTVLVFGAGTDYALLLVARYREELHHFPSHTTAMRSALRGVVEPIVASAATVSIGLMCLLLSQLNSNRSLGPVSAVGVIAALIVMLTFLPALLVIPSVVLPVLAFLVPTLIGVVLSLVSDISAGPFVSVGGLLALLTIVGWIYFGIMRIRKPEWGPFSRVKYPPGRWAFWPKVPREGEPDEKLTGLWSKIAGGVGRRPRMVWIVTALVMLAFAAFTPTLKASGITTTQAFVNKTDSVVGQEELAQHYPGGLGTPTIVITNEGQAAAVVQVVQATPGVAAVVPYTGATGPPPAAGAPAAAPKVVDGKVQLQVTLAAPADSREAEDTVATLRDRVDTVPGADALVGGQTAAQLDVDQASERDRNLIIPVVLLVIFLILILLLRALLAPLVLIGTVVLSYFATLGVCALVFNNVFKFPGGDTSFPLFAFVFLVALGVDYNIFLMTRVREESKKLGTRPGILKGLSVTGGVITSAGIVLAATFLVLGVLPLVFLREIGFAVAIGVLLDTFIIRTALVPALSYDIGRKIWWPSKLAKQPDPEPEKPEPEKVTAGA